MTEKMIGGRNEYKIKQRQQQMRRRETKVKKNKAN
jgi:hypothetical protein